MKKRIFSLILALVMALSALPVTALALEDTEPNDTLLTAQELPLCGTVNCSIGVANDADWYKFTLEASGEFTFKITSYLNIYSMFLYDADGSEILSYMGNTPDSSSGMRTDTYAFHLTEGTYYIMIVGEHNPTDFVPGNYTIKTDYVNANATETEDNDTILQAEVLPLYDTVHGQIALNDYYDFFKIELPASGLLTLDMTAYLSNHSLYLFNEDGNELWSKTYVEWDASAGKQHGSYSMHLLPGTYYIKVTGEYPYISYDNLKYSYGNYTLKTDFVNANANEVEPNNNLQQAQWISPNKVYNGQIALNDAYDFFWFTLPREMDLKIDMTAYMAIHSLYLFTEAGNEFWSKEYVEWDASAGKQHSTYTIHLDAGTYALKITGEYPYISYDNFKYVHGNYTFSLNTENPFKDVSEGAFYYDAVLWAVENGVTTGTGDGTTFEPNKPCTRGQVVTFLWRAAGKPEPTAAKNPFTDVKTSDYFYKAVLWAKEKGITSGTGDGTTFEPNTTCNRAQIVTFLSRAKNGQPTTTKNPFKDVTANAFYYNPVLWAVENGITTGTGDGTTFEPNASCTRGQVVTFLYRAKL